MSSKTKIVVLHMKELIYTGIFVVLGILLIVLLFMMFTPHKKGTQPKHTSTESNTPDTSDMPADPDAPSPDGTDSNGNDNSATSYIPGVYNTSLVLGTHTVDMEMVVDQNNINSIRLINLDDAVTTMYPLLQPAFDSLTAQIYASQSLNEITYTDESKYTTLVLLQAVETTLEKAVAVPADD